MDCMYYLYANTACGVKGRIDHHPYDAALAETALLSTGSARYDDSGGGNKRYRTNLMKFVLHDVHLLLIVPVNN